MAFKHTPAGLSAMIGGRHDKDFELVFVGSLREEKTALDLVSHLARTILPDGFSKIWDSQYTSEWMTLYADDDCVMRPRYVSSHIAPTAITNKKPIVKICSSLATNWSGELEKVRKGEAVAAQRCRDGDKQLQLILSCNRDSPQEDVFERVKRKQDVLCFAVLPCWMLG